MIVWKEVVELWNNSALAKTQCQRPGFADSQSFPGDSMVWVWSMGWKDPLKEEMAAHSSILAWKIPWTEEPGRPQSSGSQCQAWLSTHMCTWLSMPRWPPLAPKSVKWKSLSRVWLCDPMDCNPPVSSVHGDSPGKNTELGCHALLQGIFPTRGSNPSLPHCRQSLYCQRHQGSPRKSGALPFLQNGSGFQITSVLWTRIGFTIKQRSGNYHICSAKYGSGKYHICITSHFCKLLIGSMHPSWTQLSCSK